MKLAQYLKTEIKKRDLTITKLAKRSKISSKTLYSWLAGHPPRNLDQVLRVADVLGLTLDQLCYGRTPQVSHDLPAKRALETFAEELAIGSYEIVLRKVRK